MNYKHCCVIDETGRYKEFVMAEEQVDSSSGETSLTPKRYTLSDGERLIEANPPTLRLDAGTKGYVSPVWDGEKWVESATDEEISAWETENPETASSVEEQIAALKAELSSTDYKIIKCSEAQLVGDIKPYDIVELHAERQALRDKINELESQLEGSDE